MSALAARKAAFATLVANYHNSFENVAEGTISHSPQFIKRVVSCLEAKDAKAALASDPRLTSTNNGAIAVGIARRVMTNEKASRAFVDIEIGESAFITTFDKDITPAQAISVLGPVGTVAQLCKYGDKIGEGMVSDILILAVEPQQEMAESILHGMKKMLAESHTATNHEGFGSHEAAAKWHSVAIGEIRAKKAEVAADPSHGDQAKNSALGVLNKEESNHVFQWQAHRRAANLPDSTEHLGESASSNTCPECGRPQVDGMTLNSTGGHNKSLCYQSETGADPFCGVLKRRRDRTLSAQAGHLPKPGEKVGESAKKYSIRDGRPVVSAQKAKAILAKHLPGHDLPRVGYEKKLFDHEGSAVYLSNKGGEYSIADSGSVRNPIRPGVAAKLGVHESTVGGEAESHEVHHIPDDLDDGEAYDHTQTTPGVRGKVLVHNGRVGFMYDAWPVQVVGKHGAWDSLDDKSAADNSTITDPALRAGVAAAKAHAAKLGIKEGDAADPIAGKSDAELWTHAQAIAGWPKIDYSFAGKNNSVTMARFSSPHGAVAKHTIEQGKTKTVSYEIPDSVKDAIRAHIRKNDAVKEAYNKEKHAEWLKTNTHAVVSYHWGRPFAATENMPHEDAKKYQADASARGGDHEVVDGYTASQIRHHMDTGEDAQYVDKKPPAGASVKKPPEGASANESTIDKEVWAKAEAATQESYGDISKSDPDKFYGTTMKVYKNMKGIGESVKPLFVHAFGEAAWDAIDESTRSQTVLKHMLSAFAQPTIAGPKAVTGNKSFDEVFQGIMAARKSKTCLHEAAVDDAAFALFEHFGKGVKDVAESTITDKLDESRLATDEATADTLKLVASHLLMVEGFVPEALQDDLDAWNIFVATI